MVWYGVPGWYINTRCVAIKDIGIHSHCMQQPRSLEVEAQRSRTCVISWALESGIGRWENGVVYTV